MKKDSLPIVKIALSGVDILNNDDPDTTKIESLVTLVGRVMTVVQKGKLPINSLVTETKLSGQPHYVYVDNN